MTTSINRNKSPHNRRCLPTRAAASRHKLSFDRFVCRHIYSSSSVYVQPQDRFWHVWQTYLYWYLFHCLLTGVCMYNVFVKPAVTSTFYLQRLFLTSLLPFLPRRIKPNWSFLSAASTNRFIWLIFGTLTKRICAICVFNLGFYYANSKTMTAAQLLAFLPPLLSLFNQSTSRIYSCTFIWFLSCVCLAWKSS